MSDNPLKYMGQPRSPVEGFTFHDSRPVSVREVKDTWLTYRDVLRSGQPTRDGLGTLTYPKNAATIFARARNLFAWLRTQPGLDDREINFLASDALYPPEHAPFHVGRDSRDPRIAQIDERYGNGQLLESLQREKAIEILTRIGTGELPGRMDMADKPTPVREIIQLIGEQASVEKTVEAAKKIFESRAKRYEEADNARDNKQMSIEKEVMAESLTEIGLLPDMAATDYLFLILSYAEDSGMVWLHEQGVPALVSSVEKNKNAITTSQKREEYIFALLTLERKLPDGMPMQESVANLARELRRSS